MMKDIKIIPQIEPLIGEEELEILQKVIKSTWITEHDYTKKFENKICELTKAKYAHAYSNGTATLFSALKILGIGLGDEVIVPDFTFVATINSVILAGAKPIVVDIKEDSYNIDPEEIKRNINENTKAIIPVHLYGTSADMNAIMKIANDYNLYVIEDAAESIGVKYRGKHVGTFGDYGSFSFYGNKTITTGEGGMIISNDTKLAEKSYMFKNHGRKKKGIFIHDEIGFNFSITEMQAALGIVQLEKLDRIIELKKSIMNHYIMKLSQIKSIKFLPISPECSPVHWFTNILVESPEKLWNYLKTKGISTRRFFYPIHMQPCYNFTGDYPNTTKMFEKGLSLPSSCSLTKDDLNYICKQIADFFHQ